LAFEYLDHTADACLRASGDTAAHAFCEAAKAMFNLMVPLDSITPRDSIDVSVEADRFDLLLVEWLGALLSSMGTTGLVFSQFDVEIDRIAGCLVLKGKATGETFDPERHEAINEVKGISYAGLYARSEGDRFVVQCVVDI